MFISLIERVHESSDVETHESYYIDRVLETFEVIKTDIKKYNKIDKLHSKRLAGLAKGQTMMVVYTAVHPDDPRYGQNRKQRRWRNRVIQRLLKRARKPTQEQIDEEVNKFFEARRESGLVIPQHDKAK